MTYNKLKNTLDRINKKRNIEKLRKLKKEYNVKGIKGIDRQRILLINYTIDKVIASLRIKKTENKIKQLKLSKDPHAKSIGLKLKKYNPNLYNKLVKKYYKE